MTVILWPDRRWALGWLSVLSWMLVTGCRNDKPTFEVIALEGKIESIEARPDGTGEITLLYYSEKRDEEVIGTGSITPETEILINGAVAKLADLREGDRIRGQVRVEKRGKGRRQVALKISVDRAVPAGGGS